MQGKVRQKPVRATPHNRNELAAHQHFALNLREQVKKPTRVIKTKKSQISAHRDSFGETYLQTEPAELSELPLRQKSFLQKCDERNSQLDQECYFQPNMTQQTYNSIDVNSDTRSRNSSSRRSISQALVDRAYTWKQRRDSSIDLKRSAKWEQEQKNLTFHPSISPLKLQKRSDSLKYEDNNEHTPQIPVDDHDSRSKFKMIVGMDKFLERQHRGMMDREEKKLMRHNFGKSAKFQKTITDVIKPNFAYQGEHPAAQPLNSHRESKLNYMLDGSQREKVTKVPEYRQKKQTLPHGVNYKNIKKFLSKTIRDEL